MRSRLTSVISALALLFFSRTVPAQTLPPLPMDSHIQRGKLASGVTYYMVTDPSEKGFAEMAVVQREDSLTAGKWERLQPEFLGRMGIVQPARGFLSSLDGSTLYRLSHVPVYRTEVLDSTLLYAFERMAEVQAPQAVIVSGDIDPVELKKKMDIFSLLVPPYKREGGPRTPYTWTPDPAPKTRLEAGGPSSVLVSYASARVPRALMNTAQAQTTDLLQWEMMVLLHHRLERNLTEAALPYSDIRFEILDSSDQGGDEVFSIRVFTAPEYRDPVLTVVSATLSEMDAFGVSPQEFADAKKVILPLIEGKAAEVPSQAAYADRCVSNFLFGAHLAPFSETARLFSRKKVTDEVEARFLNQYSAAVLEGLNNLELCYTAAPDSLDDNAFLFQYNLAWLYASLAPSGRDYRWSQADSLVQFRIQVPRAKISKEKPEPVSGGTLWTFSNGVRVVYKQLPGSGSFRYALQLSGGLSQIPNLTEGEGGFIAPMLTLYKVGGVPVPVFRDYLRTRGVTLQPRADLNNLVVEGQAPAEQLELVLQTLLTLANNRRFDAEAFRTYARNEAVRPESLEARTDALLWPGFPYTPYPRPSTLTEATPQKAERFFEGRFSQVNNGILLLCGDLPENTVKKMLLKYIGGFRTVKSPSVSARNAVNFHPTAGTFTRQDEDTALEQGLYVTMDTEYALTSANYATLLVLSEAFRRTLAQELATSGLSIQVDIQPIPYPQERLRMRVSLQPVPGTDPDWEQLLPEVRTALASAVASSYENKDIEAWKSLVTARMAENTGSPDAMISALLARYGAGKDMISKFGEHVKGVNAEKLRSMALALLKGGRIEYLVP